MAALQGMYTVVERLLADFHRPFAFEQTNDAANRRLRAKSHWLNVDSSGRLSVTLTQPCFAGGSWGDREGGRSSLVHSRRNLIVQEPREVTHRAKVRGGVSWRQLQRDGGRPSSYWKLPSEANRTVSAGEGTESS
jgi:hypothetical protein